MQTILQIDLRSAYGQTRAYPFNTQAQKLASLLNRKSFTLVDLEQAQTMGFTLELREHIALGFRAGHNADLLAAGLR